MELRLKVLVGASTGKELPISVNKFFIGRADDCHLRPKSELISRHHCVLMVDDEYVGVRDLGSRNGTYVNNERVLGERPLASGDRLKVGPLEFEVHLVARPAAKKLPKVESVKEVAARTVEGSSKSEVDVTQWLGDQSADETTVSSSAATEELSAPAKIDSDPLAGDTEEIGMGTTIMSPPPGDEPTPAQGAASVSRPGGSPPPRPSVAPRKSADSSQAAADVLRNLFRRR